MKFYPLMQAHPGPPVRVIAEFKAENSSANQCPGFMSSTSDKISPAWRDSQSPQSGKPGQKITLRFAERLNPDGGIYTTNLRTARATDAYICKGGGVEIWEPHFTFHGFQYVEVTGLKKVGQVAIRSLVWL